MSRLIEIQPAAQEIPADLTVTTGDVLRFAASGGRVREGGAVELIGIFTDSVVGTNGSVLAPAGTPNTVLFRARTPGHCTIDVVTGDPWRAPVTRTLAVTVE